MTVTVWINRLLVGIHFFSYEEFKPVKSNDMGKTKNTKTIKGKDANGTFHPGKGKPSGINKDEGLGLLPTDPDKMDQYFELTEKYTDGEESLAENVPVRHKNRNTSKGEDTYKAKQNTGESNKSDNQTFAEDVSSVVAEQLPGVLTRERFTELANYQADCTVSLFMPTHRAGVEVNEQFDPIAFKNALNTIEQTLREKGRGEDSIKALLQPGYELVRDDAFWLDLSEGLAVFIADGFFKYIKMPVSAELKVVVEPTFYVTPLIPILTSSEYFYLLVISKHKIKLFKGDAFGMYHLALDLPQGIEEVKRLSGLDATTFRTGESGRRAPDVSQPGQTHGSGGGNPDDKDNIATYFKAIDDILWEKVLNKENVPLLLAGVEYEIPIYKATTKYKNVWEQGLTGNREYQDTDSLYRDAKELLAAYFLQKTSKALELYGNKSGTALTTDNFEDIIPASFYGRISHLFVCQGEHLWGSFDEMGNELNIHAAPETGSEDLIDHAVVKTLATGGEVFLLQKEAMPAAGSLAAILRY
ncbi:MAG: hypothetical protein V4717_02000 [Bacteroidota bacterium]